MMQDLDEAGGIPAVMKELQPLLDTDVMTVTGQPLSESLKEASAGDGKVIRSLDDPLAPEGGLMFLQGSLAPEGALVKQSAVPVSMRKFSGTARSRGSKKAISLCIPKWPTAPRAARPSSTADPQRRLQPGRLHSISNTMFAASGAVLPVVS